MVFWKSWFGWVKIHTPKFVVSGPNLLDFFSPNNTLVYRLLTFDPFQRYPRLKTEDVWNRAELSMFGPKNFAGVPTKFWDIDYKIEHTSDHVAKFHGDRLRELWDPRLKFEKKTAAKHKTAAYYRTRRPKTTQSSTGCLQQTYIQDH